MKKHNYSILVKRNNTTINYPVCKPNNDKYAASRSENRVRESYLLFSGFIGGVIGSLIGMILFRHKTKKKKFWILNILFMLMWCYIIYMFYINA